MLTQQKITARISYVQQIGNQHRVQFTQTRAYALRGRSLLTFRVPAVILSSGMCPSIVVSYSIISFH